MKTLHRRYFHIHICVCKGFLSASFIIDHFLFPKNLVIELICKIIPGVLCLNSKNEESVVGEFKITTLEKDNSFFSRWFSNPHSFFYYYFIIFNGI